MNAPCTPYLTAAAYARDVVKIELSIQELSQLGRRATSRCRELGITPGRAPDPRFGIVNAYPREVLSWAWNSLAEDGGWDPAWRLEMGQRDVSEAEEIKALDEAASELSGWIGNEDLENLGLAWHEDEWPEIADGLESAFEQVEDNTLEVQGDLKALNDAADARKCSGISV
jgi:hypothetical protein